MTGQNRGVLGNRAGVVVRLVLWGVRELVGWWEAWLKMRKKWGPKFSKNKTKKMAQTGKIGHFGAQYFSGKKVGRPLSSGRYGKMDLWGPKKGAL